MSNNKINYLLNQYNVIELEEVIDDAEPSDIFSLIDREIKHKNCDNFLLECDDEYFIRRPLFDYILSFDPTKKFIYLNWLLTLLKKKLKDKNTGEIVRFLFEDLHGIRENLELFESLKKKKIFSTVSKNNLSLHNVKNFLDINTYKDSETLYDAIFPFLERDNSGLLGELRFFTNLREAQILFEDKDFIVYTPLKLRASVIFKSYANWCTAKEGNTMFARYKNYRSSTNKQSKLYVIIRKSDMDMYQIHFESEQIHDKSNKPAAKNFSINYLDKSPGLDKFFHEVILSLLNNSKNNLLVSTYTRSALALGYSNILLNFYDTRLEKLRFESCYFRSQLNLNKFTKLEQIVFNKCNMKKFFDEFFEVKSLKILSLPNNLITEIPEDVSKLKQLYVLNLENNNISKFHDSISKLDPENGGSLVRLTIKNNKLTDLQLNNLKKLLPNVSVE